MKIEVRASGTSNELFNFQKYLREGDVSIRITDLGLFQMDFGDRVMFSDSPLKVVFVLEKQ